MNHWIMRFIIIKYDNEATVDIDFAIHHEKMVKKIKESRQIDSKLGGISQRMYACVQIVHVNTIQIIVYK